MRRFIILVLFLITGLTIKAQDCPGSISRVLTNGIHKYYWNGQLNNIGIKRTLGGPNVDNATATSIIRDAIYQAAIAWSNATQGAITFQEGTASDNDLLISIVEQSEPGNSINGIQIANNYLWTDVLSLVNPNGYGDIYTVFLHEMGHIFGANHSTTSSVMNYIFYQAKRALTDCDKSSLVAVYNPIHIVNVKNDFAGGKIKVDYTTYTDVPLVGLPPFNWRETTFPHNLTAFDNQEAPDGYKRRWYRWSSGEQDLTKSLNSPTTGTFEAQFRKEFKITFQNSFIGVGNGGSINVNGQSYSSPTRQFYVREDNTISASAQSQTINGINYTFTQWNDGITTSNRTFYPNDHKTYTANFIGKPANEFVSFGNSVGYPIEINWVDNNNTNVTQYQIWRIVKHNGVTGPATQIATVSRGVQTYTDNDYLLTASYTHDLLQYDVRAFYSTEGTYSDQDYKSVYGQYYRLQESNESAETAKELPTEYSISNYPNPFNPTTTISYQIPKKGFVSLKVYDMLGKEVASLVNENKNAGYYNVNFDASKLTSGIYIYTIQANNFVQSKKVILVK